MRLELTNTGSAIRRLSRLATRAHLYFVLGALFFDVFANETNSPKSSKVKAQSSKYGFVLFGTEGEIRTLEASLEDSHVSSYITSAKGISDCGFRISNCFLSLSGAIKTRDSYCAKLLNPQSEIRNLNWNSWQDSNPQPRRSKRRALPVELQERREFRISDCGLRIADWFWSIVPDSNRCLSAGNAVS